MWRLLDEAGLSDELRVDAAIKPNNAAEMVKAVARVLGIGTAAFNKCQSSSQRPSTSCEPEYRAFRRTG